MSCCFCGRTSCALLGRRLVLLWLHVIHGAVLYRLLHHCCRLLLLLHLHLLLLLLCWSLLSPQKLLQLIILAISITVRDLVHSSFGLCHAFLPHLHLGLHLCKAGSSRVDIIHKVVSAATPNTILVPQKPIKEAIGIFYLCIGSGNGSVGARPCFLSGMIFGKDVMVRAQLGDDSQHPSLAGWLLAN